MILINNLSLCFTFTFGRMTSHIFLNNFDALNDNILENSLSLNQISLITLKFSDCLYIRVVDGLHMTSKTSLSIAEVGNSRCGLNTLKMVDRLHFVLKTTGVPQTKLLGDTRCGLVHLQITIGRAPSC